MSFLKGLGKLLGRELSIFFMGGQTPFKDVATGVG